MDKGKFVYNMDHELMCKEILNLGKSVAITSTQGGSKFRQLEKPLVSKALNWYLLQEKILFKFKKLSSKEKVVMTSFLHTISTQLKEYLTESGVVKIIDKLKTHLNIRSIEFKLKLNTWNKLLDLYSPRYIVSHSLSNEIFLSLVAKSRGVKIIETMHGFFGPISVDYFYNTRAENLNFMPNFLWTYGQCSTDHLQFSNKKVTIGKPHLTETKYTSLAVSKQYDYLIISDITSSQMTIDVVYKILAGKGSMLFRKHPTQEKNDKKSLYNCLLGHKRVHIDSNRDVYDSILQSKLVVVIGYVSTVAYEASNSRPKKTTIQNNNLNQTCFSKILDFPRKKHYLCTQNQLAHGVVKLYSWCLWFLMSMLLLSSYSPGIADMKLLLWE